MDLNELLSRHQRSLLLAAGDISPSTRQSALRQADDYAAAIKEAQSVSPPSPIVLSVKTLREILRDAPADRQPSDPGFRAGVQED